MTIADENGHVLFVHELFYDHKNNKLKFLPLGADIKKTIKKELASDRYFGTDAVAMILTKEDI